MYTIKTIEIQDGNENIYYPHTDSSVVRYHNSTVEKTLDDIELTIKNLSVSSGSLANPTLEDKIDKILGGDIFVDENENVFVDEEGNIFATSLEAGILQRLEALEAKVK